MDLVGFDDETRPVRLNTADARLPRHAVWIADDDVFADIGSRVTLVDASYAAGLGLEKHSDDVLPHAAYERAWTKKGAVAFIVGASAPRPAPLPVGNAGPTRRPRPRPDEARPAGIGRSGA